MVEVDEGGGVFWLYAVAVEEADLGMEGQWRGKAPDALKWVTTLCNLMIFC
jgi:hypothetical protein